MAVAVASGEWGRFLQTGIMQRFLDARERYTAGACNPSFECGVVRPDEVCISALQHAYLQGEIGIKDLQYWRAVLDRD
ncbi:hypothetical protein [Aliagarivorans marinus]|uniref:hypothetical protein n=1 Tax=Aliagarivorans marinus TaxID=561965 RepID=UPI0004139411|nr:hypothetical protein [Aliagarivorans marinus]